MNENNIVFPFDAKPNSNLFQSQQDAEKHQSDGSFHYPFSFLILFLDNQPKVEKNEIDRGFFVSDDKFLDDYTAATTADLPEDDMTECVFKNDQKCMFYL